MIQRRTALFAGAGILLALLLAWFGATVAARFIDANALRQRLVTQLSLQVGGNVSIGSLKVALLPLPHIVLGDVHVTIPLVAAGTIASASAYPSWLPLARGDVQLRTLHLVNPTWRMTLPQDSATALDTDPLTALPQQVVGALATLASTAAARAPGLAVVVTHGTLTLAAPDAADLQFTDLDAQVSLAPHRLSLNLTCASAVTDHLSATATFDPTDSTGNARLIVSRLRLQDIPPHFLPLAGLQLGDSEVSLEVRVTTSGTDRIDVVADAAITKLLLIRQTRLLPLKDAHVQLGLHHDEGETRVTLEGREIDVGAVRPAALLLTNDSSVTRMFDVLRGGMVSDLTIAAHGTSLANLGGAKTLEVHGHLTHGRVHIPGLDLDLHDVTGDAVVAGGVLSGTHLAAAVGGSHAHDGTLRLGLSGPGAPLRIEMQVEAAAAELPALLQHLAANAAFDSQLDRISDVTGGATGTLLIDGTTGDVEVTANATRLDLSGHIRGLSDSVHVSGGPIRYDGGARKLVATDVRATLGPSVLSQLALQLDWSTAPWQVVADAVGSRLVLDGIYPQLVAADWLRESPWNPKALRGVLALESAHISGPADTPSAWRFDLAGAAQNLEIESPLLRERIALRSPVSVSGLRLTRDPTADTVFSGAFSAPPDVSGSVDVRWNGAEIEVKRLQIHDRQSDVWLSLRRAAQTLDFGFKGHLEKSTVDALISDNHLLGGWIRGDLRAQIQFDQPVQSTGYGTLQAEEVMLPIGGDTALHAQRVSLDAKGGDFPFEVAAESVTLRGFTWKPVRASVKLAAGETTVAVTTASLCGIETPGSISITPQEMQLVFEPVAQHQRLESTLECLGMETGAATGEYSLTGHLTARGPAAEIGKALQGHVMFEATTGHIHRLGTVAKILSAVSVATGSIGNIGDLGKADFPYDSLKLNADVQATTLLLHHGVIDGPTAKMVAKGRIDIGARSVDLNVLVAPLRTVDTVVSHVPIVNTILGGSLISIPVKVAGPWDDPDVVPLAPSAVEAELTGFMKRTLKLPFKVIQPLLPAGKQ